MVVSDSGSKSARRILLANEAATLALGRALAPALARRPGLVRLFGDLGAGKTTLVRGILQGLGHAGPVRSPTYTLIEPYEGLALPVYHLDLYRLADPEELEWLGYRDLAAEAALRLVEWPQHGGERLGPSRLDMHLHHEDGGRRLELECRDEALCAMIDQALADFM